ncbi:MAG: protoporphyrinogen oxidase HemJ [Pseudomonadota bacterium]
MLYLWVKAFHIVFMVSWFAGLFYLPRLYVYHAMSEDDIGVTRFKLMERKLYRGIMNPAAILTVASGLTLAWMSGFSALLTANWFVIKVALVGVLIGYHFYLGHLLRCFAQDQNRHGHVFYRWINEAPVVVLIGIIVLVIVKPI